MGGASNRSSRTYSLRQEKRAGLEKRVDVDGDAQEDAECIWGCADTRSGVYGYKHVTAAMPKSQGAYFA